MFICLFVCLLVCFFVFLFESFLDTPRKIFSKLSKDLTCFSWDIVYLQICLFVFYLFIFSFASSPDTPKKIFYRFRKDLTLFSWDIDDLKNVYLFVYLLFCLFFGIIHLNHFGVPPGKLSASFERLGMI